MEIKKPTHILRIRYTLPLNSPTFEQLKTLAFLHSRSSLDNLVPFVELTLLSFFAIPTVLVFIICNDFLFSSRWLAKILNSIGSRIDVCATLPFNDNFPVNNYIGNLPVTQFLIHLTCVLIDFCIVPGFFFPPSAKSNTFQKFEHIMSMWLLSCKTTVETYHLFC